MATTIIELADNTTIEVPTEHEHLIRGVVEGQYGWIAVTDEGADYFYGLTPCCYATGKGSIAYSDDESGVVCRKCHTEVGAEFGGDFPENRVIKRV